MSSDLIMFLHGPSFLISNRLEKYTSIILYNQNDAVVRQSIKGGRVNEDMKLKLCQVNTNPLS